MHHLGNSAISAEEAPEVGLSDTRREASKEHLRPVGVLLRLLHGPRVARLRIDRPPVQRVRAALDHAVDVVRVAEHDKT